MVRVRATRTLENALRRWGFYRIAGCDEVGRGCLAGPVVAGAVVLDPDTHIPGLADSKMLSAAERERLNDLITSRAFAWSVAFVEPAEIDTLNIHRASLEAMRRAVLAIAPLPDAVLVDAFRIPDLLIAQRGVLHGDRRCAAIAAASIVAKVSRDRKMMTAHESDPRYGYDKHKGYATAEHRAAVERFGYSSLHRRSFKPQAGLFDRIE
jgi:ribonuclease HII